MGIGSEYTIQVKALTDTEGAFMGDLSVYGNIDDVGDVVEHGFFDSSLARTKRYPLLWQHDPAQPIGSFDVVDAEGPTLKIDGHFNLDVSRGREAYSLLKNNDINGLSIGYTVSQSNYDSDGIRHLLDGELMEGSLVTFPANRLARAQAKQRLTVMERKSRYAGLKFLAKMSDEERAEALEELEALDRSVKAEEEDIEEEEQKPDEEKTDDADSIEDEEDILDALKGCSESLRIVNE